MDYLYCPPNTSRVLIEIICNWCMHGAQWTSLLLTAETGKSPLLGLREGGGGERDNFNRVASSACSLAVPDRNKKSYG